jgi:nucleoside permease NupC
MRHQYNVVQFCTVGDIVGTYLTRAVQRTHFFKNLRLKTLYSGAITNILEIDQVRNGNILSVLLIPLSIVLKIPIVTIIECSDLENNKILMNIFVFVGQFFFQNDVFKFQEVFSELGIRVFFANGLGSFHTFLIII